MKCSECSITLVCWSGRLSMDSRYTFLCPRCGNFTAKGFPIDGFTDGATGFRCELRPVTDIIQRTYTPFNIKDPAGFMELLTIKHCDFCKDT